MKEDYRLYRNLYDLIHPSISRENITKYKILLKDELAPIRVFYPDNKINIENIIIYVRGKEVNNNFYDELAKNTERVVFLIEFSKKTFYDDCCKLVRYILDNFKDYHEIKKVSIMGDFEGADLIIDMNDELKNFKKVLIEPTKNNFSYQDNEIIITSKVFSKENKHVYTIEDSLKFIFKNDLAVKENVFSIVTDFLK